MFCYVIVPPSSKLKIPVRSRADPFLDQRNRIDHIAHLDGGACKTDMRDKYRTYSSLLVSICATTMDMFAVLFEHVTHELEWYSKSSWYTFIVIFVAQYA